MFHKYLEGPTLVAAQHPHILSSARYLLRRIRDKPDRFIEDLRLCVRIQLANALSILTNEYRYAGQIILRIAYGIEVLDNTDAFIIQAGKGMRALSVAEHPGAFWVDIWPILRFVPSWVPGAGFKTWAKEAQKSVTAMRDAPLEFLEKAVVGSFRDCFKFCLLLQQRLTEPRNRLSGHKFSQSLRKPMRTAKRI